MIKYINIKVKDENNNLIEITIPVLEDIFEFIENNKLNIGINFNDLFMFNYTEFKGYEIIFFIFSNIPEIQNKINKYKLKYLKKNIEYIKKTKIENGIKLFINDYFYEIKYMEDDKNNLLNPLKNLNDVIFKNNGQEIVVPNYQYLNILNKLTELETIHNVYANVLYEYIKNNISNFTLYDDYIHYGYLNEQIILELNEKLKEVNINEILQ